jgi:integrase
MPKKQKSGLYRTKVKIGVDANGKDINKWVSGSTKAELERAKQDVIRHYILGEITQKDTMFGEYVQNWFVSKRNPRVGGATSENYRTMINVHILPFFGNRQFRAIGALDVQSWMDSFKDASASKIDKLYMLIRAICRDAYVEGVIPRDISAGLLKPLPKKKDDRRALSIEETNGILSAIHNNDNQDGLLLAVLYYLGIRRGEALGLQWGDFDFKDQMVHIQRDIVYVRGKTTISDLKTDAADRYVIVPSVLRDMLLPHSGSDGEWLFCSRACEPICQSSYKRMWLRLMASAKLLDAEGKPLITAHWLRHTYATKLFYAGVDAVIAMWMLGHESYETTIDIYTHLRKGRFQKLPADMEWLAEIKSLASKIQQPANIFDGASRF